MKTYFINFKTDNYRLADMCASVVARMVRGSTVTLYNERSEAIAEYKVRTLRGGGNLPQVEVEDKNFIKM